MQLKHELCVSENRAQSINLCNQCEFMSIIKFENKEVERRMVAERLRRVGGRERLTKGPRLQLGRDKRSHCTIFTAQ